MKHLIILGDGMADEPIASLGNKTVLQAANKPHIDRLAALGRNGLLQTIPVGFTAGSEVAHLSVLGYDVAAVYQGRAVLEAAGMGLELAADELALRCNLICIDDNRIVSHSAGLISSSESSCLIAYLQRELGTDKICFHPGTSYRNLLTIKGGNAALKCYPPHEVLGSVYSERLVCPEVSAAACTAELLNELIIRSQELLDNHPINLRRAAEGKCKANSIWPWSAGYMPRMRSLTELHGFRSGAIITASNLIRGIGKYAGLAVIEVEGATGSHTTNYEGKAKAALDALSEYDFVFLHVDASDEAGHEGDVALKIKTIEELDKRLVKSVLEGLSGCEEPVAIAFLPDHATPCATRSHSAAPVPFVIFKPDAKADSVTVFDETSAFNGSYGLLKGAEFITEFLNR